MLSPHWPEPADASRVALRRRSQIADNAADDETLIVLTCDVVAAHVSNNRVSLDEVPVLMEKVYGALAGLGSDPPAEGQLEPAVPVRASIKNDHLVCLEDGKKVTILKRHLLAEHGVSPAEYRSRWGLPEDYPMVPPDYSNQRRAVAREMGLGQTGHLRRGGRKKSRS